MIEVICPMFEKLHTPHKTHSDSTAMYDRMTALNREQVTSIHNASMGLLNAFGVTFGSEAALSIFKQHGFRMDGRTVFFTENQVVNALATAPPGFTVTARNPVNKVRVGQDDFVFVPGYGSPYLAMTDGRQRHATMNDHDRFCKLVQTSDSIGMNGFMMVAPSDVPADTAHLDLLFSNIILCDKPFMGSPVSMQEAKDCIDMAAIIWGGEDKLFDTGPVMVALIDIVSPMHYPEEATNALIAYSRANQACIVARQSMDIPSENNSLTDMLAVLNAEILAGITLAQLANAGSPVIYGSTSSVFDPTSGALSIGCPELSMLVSASVQLARFYNLPSRSGGGLTDAHLTDGQAGVESALALTTAVRSGVNFILHAAGILGSYSAMSFEKFLLDEEVCRMLLKLITPVQAPGKPVDIETAAAIAERHPDTPSRKKSLKRQKDIGMAELMNRQSHSDWRSNGGKRIDQAAADTLSRRLAAYEKPDIDPDIEAALANFVTRRKKQMV